MAADIEHILDQLSKQGFSFAGKILLPLLRTLANEGHLPDSLAHEDSKMDVKQTSRYLRRRDLGNQFIAILAKEGLTRRQLCFMTNEELLALPGFGRAGLVQFRKIFPLVKETDSDVFR